MKQEKVWEGRFPSHWDITPWFTIIGEFFVILYREDQNRHRKIQVIDLKTHASTTSETYFNTIISNHGTNLLLGRVQDARSHMQLDRVTSCKLPNLRKEWSIDHSFLLEKYKLPFRTKDNVGYVRIGNSLLDITNGEITEENRKRPNSWKISRFHKLVQRASELICVESDYKELWSLNGYYGNWFQGTIGENLYFLIPNYYVVIIDRRTGKEKYKVRLENLFSVTGRIGGELEYKNILSFNNTTLFDLLVQDEKIIWVNTNKEIVLIDTRMGVTKKKKFEGKGDICLSTISQQYVLLYEIESPEYGSLYVLKLGGD
ncbi:hypothetical protein [Aneurinibacillus terranovensis]|uniref:hypothetical protein n=1 Tax=Aneurinibacillus terranovensis TaxID=278991 RepID=UPI0003FA6B6A|nr:hypothetical protein [Aneurinibacillus terranovensis]